jgi:hypothetical protein
MGFIGKIICHAPLLPERWRRMGYRGVRWRLALRRHREIWSRMGRRTLERGGGESRRTARTHHQGRNGAGELTRRACEGTAGGCLAAISPVNCIDNSYTNLDHVYPPNTHPRASPCAPPPSTCVHCPSSAT